MFSGLEERVTDIIESFGYAGIAFLVALETVFPPIPSEIVLPLAGFTAGQGKLSLVGVIVAATLGSVVGSLGLYAAGRWFGRARLYWLVDRYGRYLMLKQSDFIKTFDVFERYSTKAVMIGRLIPVVRSLISIPAGMTHMPLPIFVLYTAAGSAAWNGALIGAGYALGSNWDEVEQYVGYLQYAVILGALALVGWFIWSRLRARGNREPGTTDRGIEPR
jgi:membrane protein DedA with SNARE-associated domain